MAFIRVYSAEVSIPAPKARVYRAELLSAGQATLGPSLLGVEPGVTVTLTASATGTVASWAFTQTAGPAVTLVPSGASVSFVAPPTSTTQTVTVSAVATLTSGSVTAAGTADVEVLFATEYVNSGTAWVPAVLQTMVP